MSQRARNAHLELLPEDSTLSESARATVHEDAGMDGGVSMRDDQGPALDWNHSMVVPADESTRRDALGVDDSGDVPTRRGTTESDELDTLLGDQHPQHPANPFVEGEDVALDSMAEIFGGIDPGQAPRDWRAEPESEKRAKVLTTEPIATQPIGNKSKKRSKKESVWEVVETRYRDEGHWSDLVEMYLQRVEVAKGDDERATLFSKIAAVMEEELDDPKQALDAWVEAFLARPGDEEAVTAIARIATERGWWSELFSILKSELRQIDAKHRAIALCECAVRWAQDDWKEPRRAEPFVEKLRKLDPGHPIIQKSVAERYAEQGNFEAQREALERALLRETDPNERKLLLLAIGAIAETKLGERARATRAYEAALKIDPARRARARRARADLPHRGALPGSRRGARAEGEGREEREGARRGARPARRRARASLRSSAARRRVSRGGDAPRRRRRRGVGRARTVLRRGARVDRSRARARGARRPDRLDAREGGARRAHRRGPRAAARRLRRSREGVAPRVGLDPANEPALSELARLAERAADWPAAAAYRAKLADLATSPEASAKIHVAIGDLLDAPDRDPALARKHFEKAATIHPATSGAWEALERRAREDNDAKHAAMFLERRAASTEAPRVKAQLFVELAEMHAAMGDAEAAELAFERAVKADPTNAIAAEAMLGVHVRAGRWHEARPLCDALVAGLPRDADGTLRARPGRGQDEELDRAVFLLRTATRVARELGLVNRTIVAAAGVARGAFARVGRGARRRLLRRARRRGEARAGRRRDRRGGRPRDAARSEATGDARAHPPGAVARRRRDRSLHEGAHARRRPPRRAPRAGRDSSSPAATGSARAGTS